MNVSGARYQDASVWSSFLSAAQTQLPTSNALLVLLVLVNVPILALSVNFLLQFVISHDCTAPPVVFHWLPFVGSALAYGTDPMRFFQACKEKYGNVFTFILFGRRITVALGAKGNNFVLGGKSTTFNAEDAYTHLTTPVFGKDVVYDVPNEKFMEQKKFLKVGLTTDNMKVYVGMIEDEVETFMRKDSQFGIFQMNDINEWGQFDVLEALPQITVLTASRTLQGPEVRSSLDKTVAQLYTDLDGGFTPLNFMFPNLPLESYRKRDRAHQKMSNFYINLLRKRRESKSVDNNQDMMAALMNQSYRDGTPVPDHEVAHMLIALLMAGHHTSSATGTWAVLHLADNPAVCEAVYEEQVKHFRRPDGKFRSITYEELRDLPVLESVIRETLRMHPPIHSILRKVRADVPVPSTLAAPSEHGAYIVPKGHFVLASPLYSQNDPCIWREPQKWNPGRWNDPEDVAAKAYADYYDEKGEKVNYGFGPVSKGTDSPYQPFGAGKHRCIGEQFAYLQLSIILATLIRNVELRMEQKVPEHNYHTMIVMPQKPARVAYRRRRRLD